MTHRRTERQRRQFRTAWESKGHDDWAGGAAEVQSESDWKIMDWITELAGELLSRGQVGKDGRTTHIRLHSRNRTKAVLEIGEQVMAKPLRGRNSQKKLSFKERWVFTTWVGIDARTRHVVVIGEGDLRSTSELILEEPLVTGRMWMR